MFAIAIPRENRVLSTRQSLNQRRSHLPEKGFLNLGSSLKIEKSKQLLSRALNVIPGGSNSVARVAVSYTQVEGIPIQYPLAIDRGIGSRIFDVDGNEFIDYHLAFGPIILGHADPDVNQAVRGQLEKSYLFGMAHELEVQLCELIVDVVPCAEQVNLHNAGSDATAIAVRVARSYTGKDKIVKFEGHYHGWHDWGHVVNVLTGRGTKTVAMEGITPKVMEDIFVLPWNDTGAVERIVKNHGHEIAAIITEPYLYNYGVIPPEKGYLEYLRKITKENDIVMIFDEVITGFRLGLGGAQELLGVTPDLATFSKSIGNGFPISAVAGSKEIMRPLTEGRVGTGGTFTSSSVSVAASYATITKLRKLGYRHIYSVGERLMQGIRDAIEDVGIEAIVQGVGPGFCVIFTDMDRITNARQVASIPTYPHVRRAAVYYQHLVNRGVLIFPWRQGRVYLSMAHTEEEIDKTIEAIGDAMAEAKKKVP